MATVPCRFPNSSRQFGTGPLLAGCVVIRIFMSIIQREGERKKQGFMLIPLFVTSFSRVSRTKLNGHLLPNNYPAGEAKAQPPCGAATF